ncbi:preprotein translocase subunit SecA, partial [bacterium]|nr:preprotein translocase subunit SecA [bacterium]
KLNVHVIATNEQIRRQDYDDRIYKTRREKFSAVITEIERLHARKQPVLVGTVTVEVSEIISRFLKARKIPHSVLNAKHHQNEAEIVRNAGQLGAVTIATNMAGRGTDIKLGEGVLRCAKCCLKCKDKDCGACENDHDMTEECLADTPCGLRIIGTERHESRRIDRQLRGRSGRQGDPGASEFFISLEDDLMRLFAPERIAKVMTTLGVPEGEVIQHPLVTKAIERAQRRVEGHNFDIRKHLLDYDDVMNQQREVIYAQRLNILEGGNLRQEMAEIFDDIIERIVDNHIDTGDIQEKWDLTGLRQAMLRTFLVDVDFSKTDVAGLTREGLLENLGRAAWDAYERREEQVTPEIMRKLERLVFLQVLDKGWRDHLYELDRLKEGIGLRAYGQKEPLLEYKREAFDLFMSVIETIQEESVHLLFRAQIQAPPQPAQRVSAQQASHAVAPGAASTPPRPAGAGAQTSSTPLPEFGASSAPAQGGHAGRGATPGLARRTRAAEPGERQRQVPVTRTEKTGRNDPCP